MKTRAQERAAFVLDHLPSSITKEFNSLAQSLPAMILQNGFGLTLAFLYSKKQNDILKIIREWLNRIGQETIRDDKELMRKLNGLEQRDYLSVQAETMKLLEWVKRFSNALAPKEDPKNGSDT